MAKARRRRTTRTQTQGGLPVPVLIVVGLAVVVVVAIIVFSVVGNRPQVSAVAQEITYPTGVTEAGEPYKGGANAAVVIEEFSDFECPHCGTFANTLKAIEADYIQTGQVQVIFRNYPFLRQTSVSAAKGAECALQQSPEAFWAFHDALFENQGRGANVFGINGLKQMAQQLGLDTAAFDSCVDRDLTSEEVRADFTEGQSRGVNSTPTLFINGERVAGALSEEQLRDVITQLLASSSNEE